jgi:hypothetical protein
MSSRTPRASSDETARRSPEWVRLDRSRGALKSYGTSVSAALRVMPFLVADTYRVAVAPTLAVEMVKVTEVAPAGTVTLAGTVIAELPGLNVTTAPPAGAGAERVTVPVVVWPPLTVLGLTESALKGALLVMVIATWRVTPP